MKVDSTPAIHDVVGDSGYRSPLSGDACQGLGPRGGVQWERSLVGNRMDRHHFFNSSSHCFSPLDDISAIVWRRDFAWIPDYSRARHYLPETSRRLTQSCPRWLTCRIMRSMSRSCGQDAIVPQPPTTTHGGIQYVYHAATRSRKFSDQSSKWAWHLFSPCLVLHHSRDPIPAMFFTEQVLFLFKRAWRMITTTYCFSKVLLSGVKLSVQRFMA